MTPKFRYDPEQHCLREVARPRDTYPPSFKWQRHAEAEYQNHLASLRSIKCARGSVWPEVELREGVDFETRTRKYGYIPRAFPITKPPRMYTQAEAEEIWDAGFNRAVFECSPHNGKQPDKQQYFKTRFNVEL